MFAMMTAGVLGQQGAAVGGGGVTVVGTATAFDGGNTLDAVASLPSGSVGDLFVVTIGFGNTYEGLTPPAGWTEMFQVSPTGAGHHSLWYRVADNTEGATATWTKAGVRRTSALTYRLAGVAAASFIEVARNDGLDPPSLSPSWGSANTFWITQAQTRRTDNTLTAPSGYGDQFGVASAVNSTNVVHARIESAHAVVVSGSEDPAAWAETGTINAPYSTTIAVRPA